MEESLTVAQIAKKYNRDHSTVLRWIDHEYFPNAQLIETPAINFWMVPGSDLQGFSPPSPGPKKKRKNAL